MPRGRRPGPGTPAEKAAARREKVRLNVQAYRRRRKEECQSDNTSSTDQQSPEDENENPPPLVISYPIPVRSRSESNNQTSDDSESTISIKTDSKSSSPITDNHGNQINIYIAPNPGKQYTDALLGAFRSRFLPDVFVLPSKENPLFTPCAPWVTSAYQLASTGEKGALLDGVLALELATLSLEQGDTRLQIASRERYHYSIFNLRRGLQSVMDDSVGKSIDLHALILTCHVAGTYGVVVNNSWNDMVQHVRGIGGLIKRWTRERGFDPSVAQIFLDEYRLLEIAFCLQERRHPVVADRDYLAEVLENRKHEPPDSSIPQSPFSTLLDIGDRIPPIMEYLDNLRHKGSTALDIDNLKKLAKFMTRTICDAEKWLNEFEVFCGPIILNTKSESGTHQESRDTIRFINLEAGSVFVYAFSIKLYAYETCIDILSELQIHEAAKELAYQPTDQAFKLDPDQISPIHLSELRSRLLDAAYTLAKSVYFFLQDDKGFTGRSIGIFPLGVSHQMLLREQDRLIAQITTLGHTNLLSNSIPSPLATALDQASRGVLECEAMSARTRSYGMPLFWNNG